MRLTTKPGLSRTTTGVLPSSIAHCVSVAKRLLAARGARATSTSGILWTGLKKCIPATRSGWASPSCRRSTGSDEVFVASTVVGRVSRFQFAEDGALGVEVFDGRLDDDIDVVEALPLQRAVDGGQALGRFRLGQQAALDGLVEQAGDACQAGVERRLADLLHDHLAALERGQLGDAGAHRARADDADAPHFRRRRRLRSSSGNLRPFSLWKNSVSGCGRPC